MTDRAAGFFGPPGEGLSWRRYGRVALLGAAAGGVIYLTSAGVLHFHIGSLADWTSTLAPLLGREETAALIAEKYARLAPVLTFS